MKEPRQKERLEVEFTSSCDKYGHSFGDVSESFVRKSPQSHANAPLADRFGHICQSSELVSPGGEEAGRTEKIYRAPIIKSSSERRWRWKLAASEASELEARFGMTMDRATVWRNEG
jgi:hypothetical protein